MLYSENSNSAFYLYKIRLKPREGASYGVTDDMSEKWEELNKTDDITIYLNQYENPGSLSVMTTVEHIEILGEPQVLSEKEARL